MLQRLSVGFPAFPADVKIGIEALFKRQHLNLKFFFDQQAQSTFGRFRSRCIGIEVHHRILAEAPEQLGLQLGEGCAGAGNHVVKSGGKDRDAVHLPFDQNRVVKLLHPLFGEIQIEQHLPLRIDRRLR